GLDLARRGNCVDALPLLDEAHHDKPSPEVTAALAGCHVALGDLLAAAALYRQLAVQKPTRSWTWGDHRAHRGAARRADEIAARLPELRLVVDVADASDLQVTVDGRPVSDLTLPIRINPGVLVVIAAFAEDFVPFREELVLAEAEARVVTVVL